MKKVFPILLIVAVMALAGCTSLPHRIDLMYIPSGPVKGGSGQIYLAAPKGATALPGEQLRWVVGEIKDSDGRVTDDITSPLAPRDQITDALTQELEKAGYQVLKGEAPPEIVSGPYLRLSDVKIDLTESPSWFKVTSSALVSAKLEIWRSGTLVKTERYDASFEESYARTQPEELQVLLQKALEGVTEKAIPDVIRNLGSQ
ncbi:hypothetical protein L4X63_13490 [Geomonas sp. Red32]|uniref:hypothetical protein n=1 Tax=Geomonas sp. Red32 TaxID=2912856 RepID=UPI00202CD953|nr:hypothetical protein [Geomonas sp. Red32]MCM0082608.1 hypothetical protein [Geomonas sp. Red32]